MKTLEWWWCFLLFFLVSLVSVFRIISKYFYGIVLECEYFVTVSLLVELGMVVHLKWSVRAMFTVRSVSAVCYWSVKAVCARGVSDLCVHCASVWAVCAQRRVLELCVYNVECISCVFTVQVFELCVRSVSFWTVCPQCLALELCAHNAECLNCVLTVWSFWAVCPQCRVFEPCAHSAKGMICSLLSLVCFRRRISSTRWRRWHRGQTFSSWTTAGMRLPVKNKS